MEAAGQKVQVRLTGDEWGVDRGRVVTAEYEGTPGRLVVTDEDSDLFTCAILLKEYEPRASYGITFEDWGGEIVGETRIVPLDLDRLGTGAFEVGANALHPDYYKFPGGVEVIQISEHLTANGGQALQYVARATRLDGRAKGNPVEDLRKAQRLIEREIARLEDTNTKEHTS